MREQILKKQSRAHFQKAPFAPLLKAISLVPSTKRSIGYARVSRDDQNLAMQLSLLREAGVQKIYVEKISAKNSKRPQFNLMMKFIEAGDVLVLYAFNRLCRNVKQLLTLVDDFKVMGVTLRSITEPHIDPFTTNGRMMITVTGAVDENELNRIADRTRDGMAELKRQGMILGRKPLVDAQDIRDMNQIRWEDGMDVPEIAARYRIATSTVYQKTKRSKQKK
jgi:DNA invertase Pin-like site-specific DNA recombinase